MEYKAVSSYGGHENPEMHRCAGEFLDGAIQRKVQYWGGAFRVMDPYDNVVASITWHPGPDTAGRPDIAIRSIGCRRSAQSGNLVLTPAFFYVGGGGQRVATIATNYAVAEPITYEQWQEGVR